ncbi:MAG: PxKF domain-containing protein [Rubrobacter sp.]|nr:PxKF domain-containing protein [Rubrobacter sp.]
MQAINCSYTDGGGLTTSARATYTIQDTGNPTSSHQLSSTANANGWHKGNVTVTLSGSDNASGSGLKEIRYSATGAQTIADSAYDAQNKPVVSSEGTTTFKYYAVDNAGNKQAEQSFTVKLDKTAPNVSFSGGPDASGQYPYGSVPAEPTCTATDATSTLASCVITGYGNAVGPHTLTATATDKAGNEATATRTYTVTKATAQVNLSNLNQVYDGSAKSVGASTSNPAGLNVDVTYDGNAQAPTNAGSYAVVATVNEANYEGRATGTLSIAKASQAITFAPLANKILGAADFNVSATGGDSGNPVTFAATGSCTISGSTVHITGVGKCDIAASQAGNANYNAATSVTRSFNTIYNWNGFRAPVDNGGVFNVAKAGSSIPMKFSLSGYQGLGIIAVGYPKVTSVICPNSATLDPVEEYAAVTTNNGLTYDASIDQYNYVWKTQSTYAGKCYRFDMKLTDGTTQSALFKFTK